MILAEEKKVRKLEKDDKSWNRRKNRLQELNLISMDEQSE